MPTWEGREPSCGAVRFAGEAWTGVTGGPGGWDLPRDLEIDGRWVVDGGCRGQRIHGYRERGEAGLLRGTQEWQGSRGGDEAKLCRSEARLWGSDRTGKGTSCSHERIMAQIQIRSRSRAILVQISTAGGSETDSLLIISSSHGSASAYHPPPSPRRPHNAFFLFFLQPCLIHPYLLWLPHLMAPWLVR